VSQIGVWFTIDFAAVVLAIAWGIQSALEHSPSYHLKRDIECWERDMLRRQKRADMWSKICWWDHL
jgi:hypothetical protein